MAEEQKNRLLIFPCQPNTIPELMPAQQKMADDLAKTMVLDMHRQILKDLKGDT